MIQHIKIPRLRYIILSIFFITSSCKNNIDNDKLLSANSKKTTSNNVKNDSIEENVYDFRGNWKIIKRLKIGEWKKNEEYYYNKQEFETKYENLLVEIGSQYLTVRSPFNCYGDFNIISESIYSISGIEQESLNIFLRDELMIEPNSYIGYIELNCEYPMKKIYLFKDKLLFQEYGAFFYILAKESIENSGKICEKEDDLENFSFKEICEYPKNTDFKMLYRDMINTYDIDGVIGELPIKDTSFATNRSLELSYKIKKDTIKISQFFEAGENHYLIYKKGENGVVEQIAYPD